MVGHGVRERHLRGPTRVGAEPEEEVLFVRRYRCRACGAVMTVAPAQVLWRRLYATSAVVWALSLYGVTKMAAAAVRQRISPWRLVGATAAASWQTLRRWSTCAGSGGFLPVRPIAHQSPREAAGAVVMALTARAPPTARSSSLAEQAVIGAQHSLMGIAP